MVGIACWFGVETVRGLRIGAAVRCVESVERVVLVLSSAVAAMACSAPPSVQDRGAEKVAGTEGVAGAVLDAYAVSPSGNLILFSREDSTALPAAEALDADLQPLHGFYILDRRTGDLRPVGVDTPSLRAAAAARSDLLLGSPCWSNEEDAVRLGVRAGPSVVLNVTESPLDWRMGDRPTAPDSLTCPPWRPHGSDLLEGTGAFLIETTDRTIRVTVRGDPDRVLLDYAGTQLAPNTYLNDVRPAPVGQRIAVVVSRGLGSFTGASELFVLSIEEGESASRSLGGPVFDVRWSRDGRELFAVSNDPPGRGRAIFRWTVPHVQEGDR
jgi:hypothetical protein